MNTANTVHYEVPPELAEEFDKIMDERRALEALQARVLQEVIWRGIEIEARRRLWWDAACRATGVAADESWEYDRLARAIKRPDVARDEDDDVSASKPRIM